MLYIKSRTTRSWFTKYGYILAAQLGERLVDRCKGQKSVALTLTYDRKQYDDAQDLYRTSKEKRHVGRFMEKLGKYLGESLAGKWICKLEFQRGGWVHWHIALVGWDFIDHSQLTRLWGHGHTLIRRGSNKRLRYTMKYVCKSDGLPSFLYLERPRSVKIIRTSSGFWGDIPEPDNEPIPDGVEIREEPKQRLFGCYVCLGQLIDRNANKTVVRDDDGRFGNIEMDPFEFVQAVRQLGGKIVDGERGWLVVDGVDWRDVWSICQDHDQREAARRRHEAEVPTRSASRRDTERSEEGPGVSADSRLYLIHGGNPPTPRLPRWLLEYFIDQFGWTTSGA